MSLRARVHEANDVQATVGPSPSIWADCPEVDLRMPTQNMGVFIHEDWRKMPLIPLNTATAEIGGYLVFSNNGAACIGSHIGTALTTITKGYVTPYTIGAGNTQNFETCMQWNAGGGVFEIDEHMGKLWFEAAISVDVIAISTAAYFLGLGAVGSVVTDAIVDLGATMLAAGSFIGFFADTAAVTAFDAMYKTAAVVQTTQSAGTASVALAVEKLGFTFDPETNAVQYFRNGAKIGAAVDIDTAGFPENIVMSPFFDVKACDAGPTTANLAIKWWQAAQLY